MTEIRELARLGRAAREQAGIKVRQPLSEMVCVALTAGGSDQPGVVRHLDALTPLLANELNVKRVTFASSSASLVSLVAKPNFRALGKKFGKHTNEAAAAVRALGADALVALEGGVAQHVTAGGETHPVTLDDVTIERQAAGGYVVQQDGARFAAVDPDVTASLRSEGLAREVVSRVQKMRKELGFAVSDRIVLGVTGDLAVEAAVREHQGWIAGEVLARQVSVGESANAQTAAAVELDGLAVRFTLTRMA
jgi:isoleucyl-tRNA synthetase